MTITADPPTLDTVAAAYAALRGWQRDDQPVPLHSGDLAWNWSMFGDQIADLTWLWRRDGEPVAVALIDDGVVRLGVAPDHVADRALAERLADDCLARLTDGHGEIEARGALAMGEVLAERGFSAGELWTPLVLPLAEPLPEPGARIEVVTAEHAAERAAVHRAAFDSPKFTEARWHRMAALPAYHDAKCLVAYDDSGAPAAAITVWASGPGRPGLIEPMGVDPAFRGRGFGRAITVGGAVALRQMGGSSAWVCTPAANVGGVATYRSAGFRTLPDVADWSRHA